MKRLFIGAVVALCSIVLSVASASAEVEFREPHGFGKATFGMSLAQVTAHYPKLHPDKAMEAAAGKRPPWLTMYELDDEAVGTLNHCKLALRFLNDEFYEIQFRCPERVKVGEYLAKTYGQPTNVSRIRLEWTGKHSSVWFDSRIGVFGYNDLARSQVEKKLLKQAPASPP